MEYDKSKSRHSLAIKEQPGHPQTVAVFEALAKGFNVDVTDEHLRYWRSMLTVGRAIDSYVDTVQPESIEDKMQLLVAGLPVVGVDDFEAREFRDVIHNVTEERRAGAMDGFLINHYATEMRFSRGYARFINLRLEEAELFGRVMQLDNPEGHPDIEKFNEWLPHFARAGYLIDSFGDLSEDFKDGVISMRPSVRRRLKLGKAALRETKTAVSSLPLRTIGFLAIASVSKGLRNGLKKKVAPPA